MASSTGYIPFPFLPQPIALVQQMSVEVQPINVAHVMCNENYTKTTPNVSLLDRPLTGKLHI